MRASVPELTLSGLPDLLRSAANAEAKKAAEKATAAA
jgi:hypothetical protein